MSLARNALALAARVEALEAALREIAAEWDGQLGTGQMLADFCRSVLAGGDAAPSPTTWNEAAHALHAEEGPEDFGHAACPGCKEARARRCVDAARALATEVRQAMEQDCGPIEAEPYASWAKALAEFVIELTS